MWPFGKKKPALDVRALGQMIYADEQRSFDEYFTLYSTDKDGFVAKYGVDIMAVKGNPSTLELLFMFGEPLGLLADIDWRGEENCGEIEEFIEGRTGRSISWRNSAVIRRTVPEESQRNGKFILKLLRAIDSDMTLVGQKLIFFEMSWDSYVFASVDQATFNSVISTAPGLFHGVERL